MHQAPSRLFPRATTTSVPSGKGRCNAFASGQGAKSHAAHSSRFVRITGIAFGCIAPTGILCVSALTKCALGELYA